MRSYSNQNGPTVIQAVEHIDAEGSVVRSGLAVAEAALQALESGSAVEIDLQGVKGASSSYFNVMLRRIDEGCGLAALDEHIRIRFSSRIQKIIFQRSLDSVKRGPRAPTAVPIHESPGTPPEEQVRGSTFWRRIVTAFLGNGS